jgi:hypothetical protein
MQSHPVLFDGVGLTARHSALAPNRDLGHHLSYHMVMARREVLVQLDDDLVGRLDELAKSRGTNRSELLRRGAFAVLEAEDLRQSDVVLQDAYRRQPQDPDLIEAALRLAGVTASEW